MGEISIKNSEHSERKKMDQRSIHVLGLLIVCAFLVEPSLTQKKKTVKGCLTWNSKLNRCQDCYKRNTAPGGCGPLLAKTDCLIHREALGMPQKCDICAEGFAVGPQGNCIPGSVFDCAVTVNFGRNLCFACANGLYPSIKGCSPVPAGTGIANCEWGTKNRKGVLGCLRCSPGYTLNGDGTQCVKRTLEGCWGLVMGGANVCKQCDVLAGYSMQPNGKCLFLGE